MGCCDAASSRVYVGIERMSERVRFGMSQVNGTERLADIISTN